MEPRQFVYLDTGAVRSLLASHSIAAPDEIRETKKQVTEGGKEVGFDVGFSVPGLSSANFSGDLSDSEIGKSVLESNRKVNEQYLFNILHDTVENSGELEDFTQSENSISANTGDIIKISGEGSIDDIYTMMSVFEYVLEYTGEDSVEEIREAREIAYDDKIGFSIDVPETTYEFGMVLGTENLWVNSREMMQNYEYTIFGRVRMTLPKGEKWDYMDIMRLASVILDDDTMTKARNTITKFLEGISNMSPSVDWPDLEDASEKGLDEFEDEQIDTFSSAIGVEIDQDDLSLEGPGFVIEPIAIYW